MAVISIVDQEELFIVADCGAGDVVGNFVAITGVVAQIQQVTKADPVDPAKMPSAGVIVEKPTGTTCLVQRGGEAAVFSGLTIGKTHFVGLAGTASLTPPVPAAGQVAQLQIVGIATDTDTIFLESSAGFLDVWIEDEFVATLAQVTFILSQAPRDLDSLQVLVNGILYDDIVDYTLSGTTLTWLNTPFAMDAGEQVLIRYL